MNGQYYENMKREILSSRDHYVDSRNYRAQWSDKWVAYCDLIGFAEMCKKSQDTTVNAIIRFHRAVNKAKSNIGNSKTYQFTDAAFFVADDVFDVLNFSIRLANYSLAHNAITIENKSTSLFHHMIVPRITVAYGDIVGLDNIQDTTLLSGLNRESFLAGSAIVNAHNIEKLTYAGAIAICGSDLSNFIANISVRGNRDVIKNSMQRWLDRVREELTVSQSPLVELPWPFLAKSENNGEFWTESKSSFLSKLNTLIDISDKMSGDFVSTKADISIGKHQVGIQRFIFQLLCEIKRQKKFNINKFRNPRKFIEDI